MLLDHHGKEINPTSTLKPWYQTGRLQWGGNPFNSLGMEWCLRCRSEVDCDTSAQHRGSLYVYKRWCLRCGWVIKYGAYQTPLINDHPLAASAVQWVTSPEKDRR